MRIFHLARRPPQWLRVALAGLLFAFALNSIAHATHQHEATPASAVHGLVCSYCVAFGGLADAPRHGHSLPIAERVSVYVASILDLPVSPRPQTAARPRAPPVL